MMKRGTHVTSTVVVSSRLGCLQEVVAGLEGAGCEVVLTPEPPPGKQLVFTPSQIAAYFRHADGFIGSLGERYSREVLEAGERLKIGCSYVIGTENIDVEAATELGIAVAYGAAPETFIGVAEAVVLLTAALLKGLPAKQEAVRSGGWKPPHPGRMVWKRTIGLVGLGNIGRQVAIRLQGWDCKVIAADPYVSSEAAAELGVQMVDLNTLLRVSDVVSLHVVLTPETHHLIGERELSLMRPDAYLVNTSRGAAVDEAALCRALDSGRLAGVGIDAWEREPAAADHSLRNHPRAIATGHNIGHSEECYAALAVAAVENTLRGLRGEEPLYLRNPRVLPAWRERLDRLTAPVINA